MPFTAGRPVAEAKADLFKALSHPARIRVLEQLVDGERSMGELAAEVGMELSHLSQHVTQLRRVGLVRGRRVKNVVLCELADPETAELLAVARRLIGRNLRESQELLAAIDAGRVS